MISMDKTSMDKLMTRFYDHNQRKVCLPSNPVVFVVNFYVHDFDKYKIMNKLQSTTSLL